MAVVNYVTEPSAEVSITTWLANGTGATVTGPDATQALYGTKSGKVVCDGTVAGQGFGFGNYGSGTVANAQTWAASVYVYQASGSTQTLGMNLSQRDSGGAALGDLFLGSVSVPSGSWTRLSGTATLTNAAVASLRIKVNTQAALALTFWADGVMLEQAASVGTYVDGDTAGYAWSGTAHASATVTGAATYINVPVGPPNVFRFGFDNGPGNNASPGEMYNGLWDNFTYSGGTSDIFWPGTELVPGWPAVVGRLRPTSPTDSTGNNQRAAMARIPHHIITQWGTGTKYLASPSDGASAGSPYWISFPIRINAGWQVVRPTTSPEWANWGLLTNLHDATNINAATSPWAINIATKNWSTWGVAPDTTTGNDPTPTGTPLTTPKLSLDIAGGTFLGTQPGYVRAISHFDIGDFVPGTTYFFDLYINPSPDPTVGQVECWVNGVQKLAPTNCRTAWSDGALGTRIRGGYVEFENYRPSPGAGGYTLPAGTTNDEYVCGIRVGDTRALTTFWQGSTQP